MAGGFTDGTSIAAATAFWLGLLTSVSPCPLASNIAAVAYIGKGIATPRRVLAAGVLYTAGRAVAYALLGSLLVASLATVVGLSNALQRIVNQLLGPILVVAGMFLLELLAWSPRSIGASERLQRRAERWGLWGAAALGAFFALSFCPVSAALFFGSLIPLAVSTGAPVFMPTVYGVGSGIPVLAFAVLVACGSKALSGAFGRITKLEVWARRSTGVVFIVVGAYYAMTYIFEVEIF
jgi:cytochrome c-type biogenesis protein